MRIRNYYPTSTTRSSWDDLFRFPLMESSYDNMLPSVNVKEGDEAYEIELASPGYERSDFNIEVENNILSISANRESDVSEEKENYRHREFSTYNFKRTFRLPDHVNSDNVEAKYENGILRVLVPKSEQVRPRVIEIS